MKYAVHNYHTPAIAINDDGTLADPARSASLPRPLAIFETFEEAEQWRAENVPFIERRDTETIGSDRNR